MGWSSGTDMMAWSSGEMILSLSLFFYHFFFMQLQMESGVEM